MAYAASAVWIGIIRHAEKQKLRGGFANRKFQNMVHEEERHQKALHFFADFARPCVTPLQRVQSQTDKGQPDFMWGLVTVSCQAQRIELGRQGVVDVSFYKPGRVV